MSYQQLLCFWHQHQDAVTKFVFALAAPGGIWFWVDKIRNRVRIRIRDVRMIGSEVLGIAFEAENISSNLTSFEPRLLLTGYDTKRMKVSYTFTAFDDDRQLTPLVAKQIVTNPNAKEKQAPIFLWSMTLTITLTRGRKVRVRILNADFRTLGFPRFQWGRFSFLVFRTTF